MKIILIGMPGSGKSTLGRVLAKMLQYQFIDLDERIEAHEGKTIAEIFAAYGEEYFRNTERKILNSALQESNAIISTGGGAPCFFDNMEQIKSGGTSIYLNVSIEALLSRLNAGKATRPMLSEKSDEELRLFLDLKLKERAPFYEQADYIFTGDATRAEDILAKINILP